MAHIDVWVVSFPQCTTGSHIVGSCCIRSHTTANTHVTTPNIVGVTVMGVVASVYTQPKERNSFYCTVNISITFLYVEMSSENLKILLAYKSERNVTKHSLNRACVLLF